MTAVEWLEEKFDKLKFLDFEQAKEMEKEQIVDCFGIAYTEGYYGTDKQAEQYYNEKFKNK